MCSPQLLFAGGAHLTCRHGMLVHFVNMHTGESHGYATLAVSDYAAAGIKIGFAWYDISCRWYRSFEHHLSKLEDNQTNTIIKACTEGMQYLLPPVHVHSHM